MILLANMGLPMVFIQFPGMIAALIPIIVIEALFVKRRLALSCRDAFRGITAANLVSTILGIPVAWLVLVVIQSFLLVPGFMTLSGHFHTNQNSPLWMVSMLLASFSWPFPGESSVYWMIPAASALLLFPSYFASVWIERPMCCGMWRGIEASRVHRAVTLANRLSYAVLFLFACGWLTWGLRTHV